MHSDRHIPGFVDTVPTAPAELDERAPRVVVEAADDLRWRWLDSIAVLRSVLVAALVVGGLAWIAYAAGSAWLEALW